jgi:hypothetical protein
MTAGGVAGVRDDWNLRSVPETGGVAGARGIDVG